MNIPVILVCDTVVYGSTIQCMVCAISHSSAEDVILVSPDTFMYSELIHSGDDRVPIGSGEWLEKLFPSSVMPDNNKLHPDKLLIHGEKLMQESGVRILYACRILGQAEGHLIFAHKSGLYAIRCGKVYECQNVRMPLDPAYCLHVMVDGIHETLVLPVQFASQSPSEQYLRYSYALDNLPPNSSLARGGTDATEIDGLKLDTVDKSVVLWYN